MSEIKFDLNAWKEANELINEQLTEYLTKKNLCEQWKYLMDEESTFGFLTPILQNMFGRRRRYIENFIWDMLHTGCFGICLILRI